MTGSRPASSFFPARPMHGRPAAVAAGPTPQASSTSVAPSWRRAGDATRLVVLDELHCKAFTAHLLSLDTADRYDRFWSPVNDAFIERYGAGIGGAGHVLVGAMRGHRIVGLAHAALYADGGSGLAAEIGISIDADARKQGLGKRLLRAALEAAEQRLQASRVHVLFMTTNAPMAALARSLGGRIERDGSESSAVFDLPVEGEPATSRCLALQGGASQAVRRPQRVGWALPAWGDAERNGWWGSLAPLVRAAASGVRPPARSTGAARSSM